MFCRRISRITGVSAAFGWAAVLVAVGLAAHPPAALASSIASVSITGNVNQPRVSVVGVGFGAQPSPDPAYPALGPGSDPANGYDYGSGLYFSDTNSPSSQSGPWAAGLKRNGRAASPIGLRVASFTDSNISFALGDDYSSVYQPKGIYVVGTGDSFIVHVNGLTCSGTVDFSGNPLPCVAPAASRIATVFIASWTWNGQRTALTSMRVRSIPRNGTLAVRCLGPGCPSRQVYFSARHIGRLQRLLKGRELYAGTSVLFTVSAPHKTPERILFVMRRGRQPSARRL